MALKCETNSKEVEYAIHTQLSRTNELSEHRISINFDQDQWYLTCLDCGASWSVNDAEDGLRNEYFDFDQIDDGDEYCLGK